jgi:hypothetical protein
LLDPDEMARTLQTFARAMREGLGLGPAKGIVAIDGKRLRRGYERGRAFSDSNLSLHGHLGHLRSVASRATIRLRQVIGLACPRWS